MHRAVLILLAVTPSSIAIATGAIAKSEKPPTSEPMRIAIVRDSTNDCGPACAEWIMAQGDIVPGSTALFKRVLKLAGGRKLPIFVHSRGGKIDAALAMGRMIRASHLEVTVSQTILDPCDIKTEGAKSKTCSDKALTGRTGTPRSYNAECASSCAFLLAAGERRHVPYFTYVGVHQFTNYITYTRYLNTYLRRRALVNGRIVVTSQKLVKQKIVSQTTKKADTPKSTYDQAARYFRDMGISDDINTMLRSTPADGIHWLTPQEQTSTGMMNDRVDASIQVAQIAAAGRATAPAPVVLAAATPAATTARLPPLPTEITRTRSYVSADSYIPLGRYRNADSVVDVTIHHRLGTPIVTIDFTPRNGAGPIPTTDLVASVKIGDNPQHKSLKSVSSGAYSPLSLDIPVPEFCTLQQTDALSLGLAAESGTEFEEGRITIQTESRFMTAHALLQDTCAQAQAAK